MAWLFPLMLSLAVAAPTGAPPDPPAALAAARAALKKKKRDVAGARAALAGVAQWENALQRAQGLQVLAEVELADKKPDAAVKRYKDALGILDETNASAKMRNRLVAVMKDFSVKQKHKGLETWLVALKDADAAVTAAEKWPLFPTTPLNPSVEQLDNAVRTYEGQKVRTTRARALLAVALGVEGKKAALERAKEAVAAAPSDDTPDARKLGVALLRSSARARVALAKTDVKAAAPLEKALRDAVEADSVEAVGTGLLSPYQRTNTTAQLCDAVDAAAGPGTCRKLEQTGGVELSFRDFSKRPAVEALSEDDVNRTQAEYGFLLERCLHDGAKDDPVLFGTRFELQWVVQPDGRVDEVQVDPRRFREHAAATCLRNALARFRYPPYRSAERRVVAVPIQVNGY